MGVGLQGHVGIGPESTWGTAVAATDYIEIMNESIVTAIERFETRNVHGGLHEPDDEAGVNRHSGDVVAMVHPEAIGHFMKGVFGASSVSSLDANLNQNDFTPATAIANSLHPLPPYTLEVFRPGAGDISSSFRYSGVNFSRMEVAYAINQDVRATFGLLAKDREFLTKSSPTFPGSPVSPLTFDTASLELGGAAIERIEGISVVFDNQLQGVPTLNNSQIISRIRRGGAQTVRAAGTIEFVDHTDYTSFLNGTEQQLILSTFKASSFSLVVDLPRFIYTAYPVQIGGRDRLTVSFEGIGRYHSGSGNAIRARLTTINSF